MEKFSDFLKYLNEQDRNKIKYLQNYLSEKYIMQNKDYILENLATLEIEKLNRFTKPIDPKLMKIFEIIGHDNLRYSVLSKKLNTRTLDQNIGIESMVLLIEKFDIDNEGKENFLKENHLYKKIIESRILSYEQIIDCIKDNFNIHLDKDEFILSDIENAIHTSIGQQLSKKIIDEHGSMEKFRAKNQIIGNNDAEYIYLATITNKLYKVDEDFTKYIIDHINEFNIDNINNVLEDESLLLLFPESIKSRDYLLECLKSNKQIEVREILEKLNKEEQLTGIDDRRKQWLETYEKYGSPSVLSLSDKLLKTLSKEKVSDSLFRTHGIFNSEDIILTGILGNEIYNITEDERNRFKSHLNFFDKRKISDSEIEFFKNQYKTIAKEDVNILDVYYIMNIKNNPEVSKMLSNFPENLREQVLKVNLRAKDYEIINVIDALKNDKVASSLQIEGNENIKRNLSSMPKEKMDELRKLVSQTDFKKYKTKLDINPDITIGYEVEVEGVSPHIIKNILANDQVKDTLFQKQNINPNLSKWGIKYDPTVNTGVELVSPILMDNEEDWKDLKDVINMLKSLGGKIDGQCGGHIHIGSNILGTDEKAWENFLTIWSECESSIYKISNPANENFRDGVGEFASPTKSIIDEILKKGSVKLDTHEDVKKLAEQYSRMYIPDKTKSGRYKGLNLKPISDGKQNTVEFRMPNGQLDAIEVQRNIELFARVMEVSKKISIEPEYKKKFFDKMKNKEATEEEKLMCLLDLSFDSIVDKSIYYERYLSRDKELIISNEPYEKFVDRKPNYDDNERF